ncbi:anti-sigma factor [Nitratireductor basaltis]|uniref:Regulator of SigK n=1 Tax=Nitratireductor basaltis TaxID=472175 RepID=A0A084UDD4_9HYPH|nr:anti-sigma factor [Nitratireductor basaltis]KFB10970.1 Anti-sigma K factor RskA [Nitratireductor basaltis]
MSEQDNMPEHEGGDDLVAAEFVLGALDNDERASISRRIEQDPEFARLVDDWEERLEGLGSEFKPVEPPAQIAASIRRRLFDENASYEGNAPGKGWFSRLWNNASAWRALAAAAVLAFAGLSFYNLAPRPAAEEARYVSSLAPTESDVHYFVVYDARDGNVRLSHVTGARPEGRDFELWVIEDGTPRSLGVIPEGQRVRMAVADRSASELKGDAIFAITTEPQGGSPSGAPTGPVVAQGDINAI